MMTDKYLFSEKDVFFAQGLWQSFRLHGRFSSPKIEEVLGGGIEAVENAHSFWQNANRLLVTLGTAWVFEHRETGKVVANCHRVAASAFRRRRLSVEECVQTLETRFEKIFLAKPDLKIVVSVSPVRHLKDGFADNSRSKATLLLAAEALEKKFPKAVF